MTMFPPNLVHKIIYQLLTYYPSTLGLEGNLIIPVTVDWSMLPPNGKPQEVARKPKNHNVWTKT